MNLVIFLPNWIGDVVMCTPALRALRRQYPDARLVGVLRPYVAEVLAGTHWLDEQLLYDPKKKNSQLGSWSLIKQLRARRPEMVVLLTNSLRTGVLAWASGARQRVGYARDARGLLLTKKLYAPRAGRRYLPIPAIDAYLEIAYACGCPTESPHLELGTLREDEQAADAVWRKLQLPGGDRVVVLNSGGAFGAAKLWPAEHFARLARRIATEHDLSVLVNCGPAERQIAKQIVDEANHPNVTSLAGEQVPIGLSKAVIRRSRLLISTDSGPRFFGVAFGVPTVSLFGPTIIEASRTYGDGELTLQHDVPCGPCMERTCPLVHHRCMQDLSVERVYAAVHMQLARKRLAAA